MTRAAIEALLFFLTPFFLFALWLLTRKRSPFARAEWSGASLWLVVAGLVLVIASFVYTGFTARHKPGEYEPAHMENGVLVPGRVK